MPPSDAIILAIRNNNIVRFVFKLVIYCGLVPALGMFGCDRKDQKTQQISKQKVVVYTSVDMEYAQLVITKFTELYPDIDIVPRYDNEATKTTGLVERIISEKDNPQADIFWSSEIFLTVRLAGKGLLKPLKTEKLSNWPESFRDTNCFWYGFAARARVIGYVPERVTDPPATWEELTDPKWRARILIADPNLGTTRGHLASLYMLWGEKRYTEYLTKLVENDIRVVQSNSQCVRDLLAGIADLCFTDTDDVWAQQRNGKSIELIYPRHNNNKEEAGGGTLLIPNSIGLIAGRPENNAAVAFIEFLLSDEGEMLLHESDSHNIPINAKMSELEKKYQVPDPLMIDYAETVQNMPKAIAIANRILLRR